MIHAAQAVATGIIKEMNYRGCAVLIALSCASMSNGGEPHWVRIQSPNFEMYSSAGEKSSRETLRYFEQVRGFFTQAFGDGANASPSVCIVAFNSKKEFEP